TESGERSARSRKRSREKPSTATTPGPPKPAIRCRRERRESAPTVARSGTSRQTKSTVPVFHHLGQLCVCPQCLPYSEASEVSDARDLPAMPKLELGEVFSRRDRSALRPAMVRALKEKRRQQRLAGRKTKRLPA